MTASRTSQEPVRPPASVVPRPLLSVVVPVYNGGDRIVENVEVIRRAAAGDLQPEDVEVVVVSDGSLDGTAERLLAARSDVDMRVIHYDRNLGKGYAVKLGALAAHGEWVALVDADLDLDPAAIPGFLEVARREGLDLAIGSKRHPDSVVDYPRSRRVMSWGYQQLNRVLFGLHVRDTQVGLKVFSRAVADEVVPLLLVKRFVFDLELLAVANAVGRGRVRELPVRLEYRFSGSGVGSRAVARALVDTAAVFYRLRILRTYQRKRRLVGPATRPDELPAVAVLGEPESASLLDYPSLEPASAGTELLAIAGPGTRPAGNWVSAAVPYFARPEVAAVVVPTMAPADASTRERAAAAVLESRLGGGSRRSTYFPGNVRVTSDYPTSSVVVRRTDWEAAQEADVPVDRLVAWLAGRGRLTVYTPDSMVVSTPAPLFGPHLRKTVRHACARGAAARATHGRSVSAASTLSLVPPACAVAGLSLAAAGSRAGAPLVGVYAALVGGSAALAAVRFRSLRVGLLAAPGLVATQGAYVAGLARGLARRS
ncbi:MAG TPA: glycosyltransferase family 2 protein [Gaiellaceae bacterium]|nr:glycosyltransferase family 2 protein [Gaiellaceae bacterium]